MLRYHLIPILNQIFQIFSKMIFLKSHIKSAHFIRLYFLSFSSFRTVYPCFSLPFTCRNRISLEFHFVDETTQHLKQSIKPILMLTTVRESDDTGRVESPSRVDHCSYVGFWGRVEFKNWQLFRVISRLTSSIRVWLLG